MIGNLVDGNLAESLFCEISPGVAVRSVLRSDDLLLIRNAFVFYAQYHGGGDVVKARKLLARMLRSSRCCEVCGSVVDLGVHHLNGNHGDDRVENRQTLCSSCHCRTHRTY